MVGRLGLSDVTPVLGSTVAPEFPARAVVGEQVPISALVFREGHDAIGASVVLRAPNGRKAGVVRMTPGAMGTDRWHATVVADRPGLWSFAVEAWSDPFSTWHHAVIVKLEAGQGPDELANDLETGARLFDRLAKALAKPDRAPATAAARSLRDTALDLAHRVGPTLDEHLQQLIDDNPLRDLVTSSPRYPLWVDRPRALYGSWYEFFPRSIGAELSTDPLTPARPLRHGTFKDATEHLDYVASLGFDVAYLPPIHPIGEVNRKGPNNSLVAASWDVGSPWAIGSRDGGHDAIHPDLGTMADFTAFVRRAKDLGIEVALDFALQTAPDHPWVTSHPEWFTTNPDGTIAYAENPPKKYQDIYPLNFWCDDREALWNACRDILLFWIEHGVRTFRVDNPHTKPFAFWEWMIGEVHAKHPDVVFLAEAFTRPRTMKLLAKIGFSQSYTYFTWKNTRWELLEFVAQLLEWKETYRPNLFTNTPDILHDYLVTGGRPAFEARLVLAATLSPSYGIYSGFEQFENVPAKPGSEEYLDSEKYEVKQRSLDGPLLPLVAALNRARRDNPSLQQLDNITFLETENDGLFAYLKRTGSNAVIVVVNLDPFTTREGVCILPVSTGLPPAYRVHDVLAGKEAGKDADWTWHIGRNYVRLAPGRSHVLRIGG